MAGFLDELVPEYTGDRLIRIELLNPDASLHAFAPIELSVTLTGDALTAGVQLPLELTVLGPTKRLFRRQIYRRIVPTVVTISPQEGGRYLIRLAETAHNSWWGAITLQIIGEKSV